MMAGRTFYFFPKRAVALSLSLALFSLSNANSSEEITGKMPANIYDLSIEELMNIQIDCEARRNA